MRTLPRTIAALVLALSLFAAPSSVAAQEVEPAWAQAEYKDLAADLIGGTVRIAGRQPIVGTGEDAFSVDRLYRAFFLRDPDESGLSYWLERYFSGTPLVAIAENFARSKEFVQRYGSLSDAAFVRLVYANVLDREPDRGGFDHWTGRLAAGMTRGAMMTGFSDSGEFKLTSGLIGSGADTKSVERLYQAYFLRPGDASGLAYWKSRYTDLASLLAISDAFAASKEFRDTYGALSNSAFVDLVYRNVLGRDPDAQGAQHWRSQLAAGMSRGTMMVGFSDSAEFKRTGGADYDGTPDPDPDPGRPCPFRDESGLPTAEDDQYAFLFFDDCGAPIQWAPCETVDVVANFTGAPAPGGNADFARQALVDALALLSSATRTTWRYLGTTDERAPDDEYVRPVSDPDRYGPGPSPVLISWAPDWKSGATVYATPIWTEVTDPRTGRLASRIVSGQVIIDSDWQPSDRTILVSAFLHELGHNAGLDHVQDSVQSMFPIFRQRASYAGGDKAGLARVGSWMTDCAAA